MEVLSPTSSAWTRCCCGLFRSMMFLYFNVLPLMVGARRRDTTTTNYQLFFVSRTRWTIENTS